MCTSGHVAEQIQGPFTMAVPEVGWRLVMLGSKRTYLSSEPVLWSNKCFEITILNSFKIINMIIEQKKNENSVRTRQQEVMKETKQNSCVAAQWNDPLTGLEICSSIHPRGSQTPWAANRKRVALGCVVLTLLRALEPKTKTESWRTDEKCLVEYNGRLLAT